MSVSFIWHRSGVRHYTRSLHGDNSPRSQEAPRIGRRRERVDAHMAACGGRMKEAFAADRDADMQFFVREMHEDKIARLEVAARNRFSGTQLFPRGTRHPNARAVGCIGNQAAAVEAAGRGTAEAIGLADHGRGEIDHDGPWVGGRQDGGGWRGGRSGGGRAGWVMVSKRSPGAGGQRHRQNGRGGGSDHIAVVANAAPTMPASERRVPTTKRASQCSLSMNFSGSSVMPPHRTMRSGHSNECISSSTRFNCSVHASQVRRWSTFARPDARSSASIPKTSRWPNSVFGTSLPSTNRALPMPVPRVNKSTVPGTSRAAP